MTMAFTGDFFHTDEDGEVTINYGFLYHGAEVYNTSTGVTYVVMDNEHGLPIYHLREVDELV